ncbi:extracellular solute-binding protein [Bradyrhizobium xenonodulans]|uniref:Extracellular solute-binding protein n=1 Tax=Bradyrhizobium xenonodulans TaxID=2736875 RepID=A0ABY7MI23_9BRAD|nr:extracellular solute-binding protein [Bradyrhizobium xenonodulans]WBL77834.1 extracellular solute-binding protein [Bradyrhizobium xenonodulans]
MKPMTLPRMSIASLLGLSITFASAVAPAPASASDSRVLTLSYNNARYKDFFETTARLFEAENPEAHITTLPPVATEGEHLTRTFRLAVTGELPDVSFNGYSHVAIMARRGLAVPLDRFIADEKDWAESGLTPASMEATKVRGATYALPLESSTPTLFFNKDLVRRAGGDPDHLPPDWDGIIELAVKIHGLGNNIIGGFFDYNASGNWTYQAMVTGLGGHLMNEDDTKIEFNDSKGRRALDIIRRIGQTGMIDMSQDQAFQAFSAGQMGMITQSNTFLAKFEEDSKGRFEIQTMKWPLVAPEGRVPIGGRGIMMYTTDPKKQKIVWQYMKFMTTPKIQTLLVQMLSSTPANTIAIKQPEYLGKYYNDHPNEQIAVGALPFVTGWYAFPGDNAPRIVDAIRDHTRDVAINKAGVDEALSAMSNSVKKLLP